MSGLNINGVNVNMTANTPTQNQPAQTTNNTDRSIFNFDTNTSRRFKLSATESQDLSAFEAKNHKTYTARYPTTTNYIQLNQPIKATDIKLPGIEITGITQDYQPMGSETDRRIEATFIDQETGREGTVILNYSSRDNINCKLMGETYKYPDAEGKLKTEKVVRTLYDPGNGTTIKKRDVLMYNGEQSYIEESNIYGAKRTFFDTVDDLKARKPNGAELNIIDFGSKSISTITESQNGKKVETRVYNENGHHTKSCIYDSTGKFIKTEQRFDNSGKLATTTDLKYDTEGRKKSEITNNLVTGSTSKTVYEYPENSKNYTRQVFDITGKNNTPLYAEVVQSGSDRVLERTEYGPDNSIAAVIKYEYDAQGNLLTETRVPPEDLAMN